MESAQTTQAEPQARLAVRRDLHGNTNLPRIRDGSRYARELTEAVVDAAIAHVQLGHLKTHGQSYWKLSYPKGTLGAFLDANGIQA
jgi:hypothetical protein